jgi:uncharacterized protein (TIGR02594 family)
MGFSFEELRDEYQSNFDNCKINHGEEDALDEIIARMEENQDRYQELEDRLGIPWYFIGAVHYRESDMDFDKHLHNGNPLTGRTVNVPPGRPIKGKPPFTWEESAEDALKLQDLDQWTHWDIPGILFRLEKYNGFGYKKREAPSPYLWSFSNQYDSGKYVRDGIFDPNFQDQQAGTATILRRMVDLGKINLTALSGPQVPPVTATGVSHKKYAVKSGDTLSKIAKKFHMDWKELWQANRDAVPDPNLIKAGMKLTIPKQGPAAGKEESATASCPTMDIIFRAGYSFTQIASVYGISPQDLLRLNPDLIKPGTVIKVPKVEEEVSIPLTRLPITQEPIWLQIAEQELETGVEEVPGAGDNPRILEYHSTTTLDAEKDSVPWCSSFVNWCMTEAGYQGTDSAAAISWDTWGDELPLAEPRYGCIVVSRRPGGNHVGFYLEDINEDAISLLGGNQGDAVSIIDWWKEDVISYRWPKESDRC